MSDWQYYESVRPKGSGNGTIEIHYRPHQVMGYEYLLIPSGLAEKQWGAR